MNVYSRLERVPCTGAALARQRARDLSGCLLMPASLLCCFDATRIPSYYEGPSFGPLTWLTDLFVVERGVVAKRGYLGVAGACFGKDVILSNDNLRDLGDAIALTFVQAQH